MQKLVLTLILYFGLVIIRGEKKTEKLRKPKKNNRKNRTVKKNRLKFWKNRQVWFYKPKTKKTEPNRNRKNRAKSAKNRAKPKNRGQNRFEPVVPKNRTELKPVGLNWFRFFFKNFSLIIFFDKNRTKQKIITSNYNNP